MHASRQRAIRKQDELWVICLIMQGLHIWQIMHMITNYAQNYAHTWSRNSTFPSQHWLNSKKRWR